MFHPVLKESQEIKTDGNRLVHSWAWRDGKQSIYGDSESTSRKPLRIQTLSSSKSYRRVKHKGNLRQRSNLETEVNGVSETIVFSQNFDEPIKKPEFTISKVKQEFKYSEENLPSHWKDLPHISSEKREDSSSQQRTTSIRNLARRIIPQAQASSDKASQNAASVALRQSQPNPDLSPGPPSHQRFVNDKKVIRDIVKQFYKKNIALTEKALSSVQNIHMVSSNNQQQSPKLAEETSRKGHKDRSSRISSMIPDSLTHNAFLQTASTRVAPRPLPYTIRPASHLKKFPQDAKHQDTSLDKFTAQDSAQQMLQVFFNEPHPLPPQLAQLAPSQHAQHGPPKPHKPLSFIHPSLPQVSSSIHTKSLTKIPLIYNGKSDEGKSGNCAEFGVNLGGDLGCGGERVDLGGKRVRKVERGQKFGLGRGGLEGVELGSGGAVGKDRDREKVGVKERRICIVKGQGDRVDNVQSGEGGSEKEQDLSPLLRNLTGISSNSKGHDKIKTCYGMQDFSDRRNPNPPILQFSSKQSDYFNVTTRHNPLERKGKYPALHLSSPSHTDR
jgi:hypothetical protein